MEQEQRKENTIEIDLAAFLGKILKKGIVFLLIAAILGGAVGGIFAMLTNKNVYTGTIAFWVNNMSTNYDYTSTAQTGATKEITFQFPELIQRSEPILYAVEKDGLAEKLGFVSEETMNIVNAYNSALARVETAKSDYEEKAQAAESAESAYQNTLTEKEKIESQAEIDKRAQAVSDYQAISDDIDFALKTLKDFGDSLKAANTAYLSASTKEEIEAKQADLTAAIKMLEIKVSSLDVSYVSAVPEKDEVEQDEDETIVLTLDTSVYDLISAYETRLAEQKDAKATEERNLKTYEEKYDAAEIEYNKAKDNFDKDPTDENRSALYSAESTLDSWYSSCKYEEKMKEFAEARIANIEKYLDLLYEAEKISGAVTLINHSNANYKNADKITASGAIISNTLMLNIINGMGVRFAEAFEEKFNADHAVSDNGIAVKLKQNTSVRAAFYKQQAESSLNAARSDAGIDSNGNLVNEDIQNALSVLDTAKDDAVRYIQKSLGADLKEEGSFTFYATVSTYDREKTYMILSALQTYFPTYVRDLLKLKVNENNTALVTAIDTVKSASSLKVSDSRSVITLAAEGAVIAVVICFIALAVVVILQEKKSKKQEAQDSLPEEIPSSGNV